MARIRTVKPEFFRHEVLQELEVSNPQKYPMLVFEGLWCHADKNGVFKWKPRTLKLDILPFLNFDMTDTLNILFKAKQIFKFDVEGEDYGIIPTFHKHQRIGGKESQDEAKFPLPNNYLELMKQWGSNGEAMGKQWGLQEGKGREGKGRDSENPLPLNPDVKKFIDYAFENFGKKTGEKMTVDGKKDGALVKKLLETYGLDKLKGLWDVFMQSDDPFIRTAGFSIGVFKSQVNKLLCQSVKEFEDLLGKLKKDEADAFKEAKQYEGIEREDLKKRREQALKKSERIMERIDFLEKNGLSEYRRKYKP